MFVQGKTILLTILILFRHYNLEPFFKIVFGILAIPTMQPYQQKLRLIFLPYLVIAISFIVLYSGFNWFVCQKWQWLNPKQELLEYWLPIALAWFPVTIWLRPRLKLLRIKESNLFGIQFLAVALIVLPTVIAQMYIFSEAGKITKLADINQLSKKPPTKYYQPDSFVIDNVHVGYHATLEVSGKHNDKLNYNLFVTLPILEKLEDTGRQECSYWLTKVYSEQFDNDFTSAQEDSLYQKFIDRCQASFDSTNFNHFSFLERISSSEDDYEKFKKAVRETDFVHHDDLVFFKPHREAFADRSGKKLNWIFATLLLGSLIFLIVVLFQKLHVASVRKYYKGIRPDNRDLLEIYSFFIPNKELFFTPLIIDICVVLYLLMIASGLGIVDISGVDLLRWGGNYRPATLGKNEWWRLVTNIFLHGGIMHLFANMFTFLVVGPMIELLLGKTRMILAYLVTGICASIASIWWHQATVSIGASGAIFGMYGVFLALLLLKVLPRDFSKSFLGTTIFFIIFNLAYGLSGGIDNAAHIGGLLSGIIVGILLSGYIKTKIAVELKEQEALAANE